jgi:hypothetical protein
MGISTEPTTKDTGLLGIPVADTNIRLIDDPTGSHYPHNGEHVSVVELAIPPNQRRAGKPPLPWFHD